ncbi:MAG: PilZ domain-containing protein [Thermodesulfobacteriota bacterium]
MSDRHLSSEACMNHSQKSREELEAEILALRRQVAELEARFAGTASRPGCPLERPPRLPLDADVEFMGDFDVLRARGVNISDEGICFEVQEDLPFEMRFDLHGSRQRRRAHCLWVQRLPSGVCHIGLRFVPPKAETEF